MRTSVIVVAGLGVLFWQSKKRVGSRQPFPSLPPTPLERERRLDSDLQAALSYGDGPLWVKLSGDCQEAGRPDLPGLVRRAFPELAEQFDRHQRSARSLAGSQEGSSSSYWRFLAQRALAAAPPQLRRRLLLFGHAAIVGTDEDLMIGGGPGGMWQSATSQSAGDTGASDSDTYQVLPA